MSSENPLTSIAGLLGQSLEVLKKEIANLQAESDKGKLMAQHGTNLVAYVKLLSDLQKKSAEDLTEMSDADLRRLLRKMRRQAKANRDRAKAAVNGPQDNSQGT